MDRCQAQLTHVPGDRFMIDLAAFTTQLGGDPPYAIERPLRIDCIDAVFACYLFRGGRDWDIVQTRAIETEQRCLGRQRQLPSRSFQQRDPFSSRQRVGQLFFSATPVGS